ncbi:SipW-dependent-type signal peptide-containing protein [Halobellus rufus]|uniref:SipW-dependent-type signal peptide-containing protein n=1 Tax=Halobellus rufus TaxID=1448860 RepID=UPI000678FA70|nr:SipW-dependent-type signal peptide-containing protein [Halobellus rufus]
MADESFELTRRKVLGSIGAVGAASAGAGLGTSALFSDTESFENNKITAGELDLKVDWQQTYSGPDGMVPVNAYPDHDGDGLQSTDDDNEYDIGSPLTLECGQLQSGSELDIPSVFNSPNRPEPGPIEGQEHLIELDDVKPGDSGEVTFSLHLCDNPGYLWMRLENIVEGPGETPEPEPEPDEGELAENMYVEIWYDADCDNELDDGEAVILGVGDGVHNEDVTLAEAREELQYTDGQIPLSNDGINGFNIAENGVSRNCFDGDEQYCIGFRWWVPDDVGNVIQGDTLAFDLGFYTEQCRHNDGCDPRNLDLSTGVKDWTVSSGPQTGPAEVQTPHNRWIDPANDCEWIAPPDEGNTDANGDIDPEGTYTFETTFEVDLQETPAGEGPCMLALEAATDNQATFYLDSVAEENEIGSIGGPQDTETYWSTEMIGGPITTGEHTLIAEVVNAPLENGGDNPVGLLVCGGVACTCGDEFEEMFLA